MNWWREAVGYHVYLRSYQDSDGDGIGDLPGLLSRLDHPRDLGADAVWISPFYPSPQADFGYDISDHRAVDPLFGTMSDVEALVAAAGQMGMRLLADVVPNHTSVEHPWFRAGLTDRYHFRPRPPNSWQSMFGGPAWSRTPDGQWYLHLFAPHQPDFLMPGRAPDRVRNCVNGGQPAAVTQRATGIAWISVEGNPLRAFKTRSYLTVRYPGNDLGRRDPAAHIERCRHSHRDRTGFRVRMCVGDHGRFTGLCHDFVHLRARLIDPAVFSQHSTNAKYQDHAGRSRVRNERRVLRTVTRP